MRTATDRKPPAPFHASVKGPWLNVVCPRCRAELAAAGARRRVACLSCGFEAAESAGFPDLRIASDRYLSLNQETRKAIRLSRRERAESLEGLVRHYYRMTADVSPAREARFVRHILAARERGFALLDRLPSNGRILEVGCGTGGLVAAAAEAGREIVGVDIASRWLVVARKRLSTVLGMSWDSATTGSRVSTAKPPRLLAACAEALPFSDASYPVVVADSLLEHVADPVAAIAEMVRVLAPGGTLVIWFPNGHWIGPDPHVGLMGLPLLPRRLASRYIQARRGPIHWPLCRGGRAWAKLVSGLGDQLSVTWRGADLRGWPVADRSIRGRTARFLGRLVTIAGLGTVIAEFGPLGELIIRKQMSETIGRTKRCQHAGRSE